jgi:hypothetical protein
MGPPNIAAPQITVLHSPRFGDSMRPALFRSVRAPPSRFLYVSARPLGSDSFKSSSVSRRSCASCLQVRDAMRMPVGLAFQQGEKPRLEIRHCHVVSPYFPAVGAVDR